jgi:hypothetical protein
MMEDDMTTFRLPLSGNVTQSILPWTWNIGPINVEMGESANTDAEKAILDNVGTYGSQLGRVGDALLVILDHLERSDPSLAKSPAIIALRKQIADVQTMKTKHPRLIG